jgi:hypothetical protein
MAAVAISSGHSLKVRGASGLIDEVNEARRVVNRLKEILGPNAVVFHDDISTTQSQNLATITDWHNKQTRDVDASVHFNAYVPTDGGRGTEVLYLTQATLARKMSDAMAAAAGFINRGPKKRTDLAFLNNTKMPAILLEVCFVDAAEDVNQYQLNFDALCTSIAEILSGQPAVAPPPEYPGWVMSGKVSWFGGPDDTGVAPDEGLAFIYKVADAPVLFLPDQPPGTTGLARRLNPDVAYIALRWDYDKHPKSMLASGDYMVRVRATKTGKQFLAYPADWGPHNRTGRIADISPGLMRALGVETDDEVSVEFPVSADEEA